MFSVRFTHRGRRVELSTGTSDKKLAERNARELYDRVTASARYSKPRGSIRLASGRVFRLVPIPHAAAPEHGGVYVMWCSELPRFVKIGWSSNVRRRLRHLQTGVPGAVFLLAVAPGSKADEARLHQDLSQYHARGDWFRAGHAVVKAVRSIANSGGAQNRIGGAAI